METSNRLLLLTVLLLPLLAAFYLIWAVFLGGAGVEPLTPLLAAWERGSLRWTLGFGAILYLLALGKYLYSWPRRYQNRMILLSSPLGKVEITRSAVESLIRGAAKGIVGIRGLRVQLQTVKGSLAVTLLVASDLDVGLVGLGDKLQQAVQDSLKLADIDCNDVQVTIERVEAEKRARVR
ncbi:alkaline shock response membrane anchor protein AmaP [Heliobacterium mobile]|uniref:alkaline shock response membrane anchor protein AmaP n=1 Tax=Heliobacterium mobile TaxID=28064 RepID=UPI0014793863|nr:alkaline shock response membrane anchor protein AmaP [Heliobacterium mobile]